MNFRHLAGITALTLVGIIGILVLSNDTYAAGPGDDQPTPEAEIICDPSGATASKNLDFKVHLKNYSVPSTAQLYVKVTVTWDMFNWKKTEEYSDRFSMDSQYDETHYGEFHSLVPGPGYVMRCELREDRSSRRDRTIAVSDDTKFSVEEFQKGENKEMSWARLEECGVSDDHIILGESVSFSAKAVGFNNGGHVGVVAKVYRGTELIHAYPPKDERVSSVKVSQDIFGGHTFVDEEFKSESPGQYILHCTLMGNSASALFSLPTHDQLDLDVFLDAFGPFIPLARLLPLNLGKAVQAAGHPFNFWVGYIAGLGAVTQAVKADYFCVGDARNCPITNPSTPPDLSVAPLNDHRH